LKNFHAPKRCTGAANGDPPRWHLESTASLAYGPVPGATMNFLRTLFWVVVAASLAIFANRNWNDVTINLWGNIQAEIKLPFLLLLTFLVGFLPTWLVLRGRLWGVRRKLALAERPQAAPVQEPPPAIDEEELA
jgi:uncharacterized integral membrane protein